MACCLHRIHSNPCGTQALSWSEDVAALLLAGLQADAALSGQHTVLLCVGAWARLGFLDNIPFTQAQPLVEAVCSSLIHPPPGMAHAL